MMENREEQFAHIEREQEALQKEEQLAPHDHNALGVWMLADHLSGAARERERKKAQLSREKLLLCYGYRLVSFLPPGVIPRMIYTLVALSREQCRVAGHISPFVLEDIPLERWPHLLNDFAHGQQHMCCKHCKEPVLWEKDHTQALNYLHNRTSLGITFDAQGNMHLEDIQKKLESLTIHRYRSVSGGPLSDPIDTCPRCHYPISPETVEGISFL